MMDCGFTITETCMRLGRVGLAPSDLAGILVTHEHDDHLGGVARFARRHAMPVYLTRGTAQSLPPDFPAVLVRFIDSHTPFAIDALSVEPFPVPHDAREPAQMTVSDGIRKLGVLTDVGETTAHIERSLADCDALFLEANHCEDLLWQSSYPPSLKVRIAGRFGHLSNRASADLLARIAGDRLQRVVAAHLSRQNNRAELAQAALAGALGAVADDIFVASQDDGIGWVALA